jgi:hypothetical protein
LKEADEGLFHHTLILPLKKCFLSKGGFMKFILWSIFISLFLFKIILHGQSNLNPDISAIGTFNTFTNFIKGTPEYEKLNFEMPELELFFDGYLNPYARATAIVSFEEGEFGVEELFANVVRGLPLDVQIKAGKYLVGFGKLNTVHPHAWAFIDRPLFHQIYFGADGFNDIGVNLSFILPTEDFFSSIDVGVFKGDAIGKTGAADPESNESINELRGNTPIFIGRLGTFFSLSDYSNLEIGLSASNGVHAKTSYYYRQNQMEDPFNESLNYLYGGFDFKYKYRPDSYTALTIQGEAIINNRDVLREQSMNPGSFFIDKINTSGFFIFADYLFNKTFSIGMKYDFTYGIINDEPGLTSLANDNQNKTQGISGWIGYYPVEETIVLRLGAQHIFFNYADGTSREPETTITLQMIFSLGPHKAHPF